MATKLTKQHKILIGVGIGLVAFLGMLFCAGFVLVFSGVFDKTTKQLEEELITASKTEDYKDHENIVRTVISWRDGKMKAPWEDCDKQILYGQLEYSERTRAAYRRWKSAKQRDEARQR
jgi:hypothetical protein